MPQYQGVWTLEQQAQAQSNQQWVTDPNFKNTTLLLQADGTGSGSQNQTFLDGSTNNFFITRNGNTTQGSFSPFSQAPGYWSNYFNGSSTISAASNSAFNILAYDTFECWVNMSVLGTSDLIAGRDAAYWLGYNHTSIGGTANKFVFTIYNGSSWQAVSSTTTPVVGTWYHILGVKDNTTLRFYVNGIQESTATFSGSPATGTTFYVASNNNTENLEGYVSNLRLITGASNAVFPYSGLTTGASFTPPTSPLTAVSSTQLLTCQSNRFVDNSASPFTLTTVSVPSVQAFGPFAPALQWTPDVVGGSGYFDGTGDYLSTTQSAYAPSGDFTVEAWFYVTAAGGYSGICSTAPSAGTPTGWRITLSPSPDRIGCYFNGSDFTSTNYFANQWYHVALVRSGSGANNCSFYVNGVRISQLTNTTAVTETTMAIGRFFPDSDNYYLTGYIASQRYTTSAIYSGATITVPTAPVTAVSNTQLLLNYTNAGIYDGKMANNLQTVGNAQVATSPVKYGSGSMRFNGSTDYLSIPASPNLDFGTGDFTIECWVFSALNANLYPTFIGSVTGWSAGASGHRFNNTGYLGKFTLHVNSATPSDPFLASSSTYTASTWYHYAITRSNNIWTMWINGIQQASGTYAGSFNQALGGMRIGTSAWDGANGYFSGYVDDLRFTKACRYFTTFTPPQQALPRQ